MTKWRSGNVDCFLWLTLKASFRRNLSQSYYYYCLFFFFSFFLVNSRIQRPKVSWPITLYIWWERSQFEAPQLTDVSHPSDSMVVGRVAVSWWERSREKRVFFSPHDHFPPDTSPAYESPLPSADICFSCIMPSDSALDLFLPPTLSPLCCRMMERTWRGHNRRGAFGQVGKATSFLMFLAYALTHYSSVMAGGLILYDGRRCNRTICSGA